MVFALPKIVDSEIYQVFTQKTPSNHKDSLPAVRGSMIPQKTVTSISVDVRSKYFCSRSIFIM
jgi:hypothetical protein